jgi:hypothetical protein
VTKRREAAWAAGPPIGPVQINPVGHPRLCWQAGGNGSGVTLERCDPAVARQQWSLTSNGVVMNGNGYCLEAGQAAAQAAYGVAVTFSLPPQLAGTLFLIAARRRPPRAPPVSVPPSSDAAASHQPSAVTHPLTSAMPSIINGEDSGFRVD